jgi:hypothetical protein
LEYEDNYSEDLSEQNKKILNEYRENSKFVRTALFLGYQSDKDGKYY